LQRKNRKQHTDENEANKAGDQEEEQRLGQGQLLVPRAAELDREVMKRLPPAMQFEVLEEIKLTERARRRDSLVHAATDGLHTIESFSHQQLLNYIEVSKVAVQVNELRAELSKDRDGFRPIASDATRRYRLHDEGAPLDDEQQEQQQEEQPEAAEEEEEVDPVERRRRALEEIKAKHAQQAAKRAAAVAAVAAGPAAAAAAAEAKAKEGEGEGGTGNFSDDDNGGGGFFPEADAGDEGGGGFCSDIGGACAGGQAAVRRNYW
jgi:hypothetical protein